MHRRTLIAILLNIILPGSGYLYLDAKSRKPLAYFLIFITLYEISRTLITISSGSTNFSAINISPFFPGLTISVIGVVLVLVLGIDTYRLAQKNRR